MLDWDVDKMKGRRLDEPEHVIRIIHDFEVGAKKTHPFYEALPHKEIIQ